MANVEESEEMTRSSLIKTGQEYMRLCPNDPRLKMTFPEIKIIHLTRIGIRFMPPLATLIFIWQYYMHTPLTLSLITIVFALSLPVQSLMWLGKRAQTPLPLTLLHWFNALKKKLILNHIISDKAPIYPTFIELMKLINLAKEHFGCYPYPDENGSNNEEQS